MFPSLSPGRLIGAFEPDDHSGTYWGVRSDIRKYPAAGALPCPFGATQTLASAHSSGIDRPDGAEAVDQLGYAICDAAMRLHVAMNAPAPTAFPYPAIGVGA
jgi:NTE family protein